MTRYPQLRDLGTTYGGLTGKSKKDFGAGNAQYITFLEVINSIRLAGTSLEPVVVGRGERQNRVRRDDLLFNGSSETPEEVALSAVVDFEPTPTTYLNSFCFGYRLRPDAPVKPTYLAYYFRSQPGRSAVASLAQGATRYNIAKTKFLDLRLDLPHVSEQQAVVEALSDADELIAGLERMIAKKQAIKQGMMQQLLTGRTRLPGFTAPWVSGTMVSLGQLRGGGTPSTRVARYWGGDIPWFTPAEIAVSGSGLVSESQRLITHEGLDASSAILLPKGSVLITSRASIGHCAVVARPVSTNQGFTSLIPSDPRTTWFVYYWVQQHRSELESRAAGSTFLEISARKTAQVPINFPTLEEQHAIGVALCDVDNDLDAVTRRLAKARAIKQGMMQQLLTGRIRLPIEDAS